MPKNMKRIAFVFVMALAFLPAVYGAETSLVPRPAHWAEPMQVQGIPNLYKVSDTLYRSAQPSEKGMGNLKTMGVETIVNLRSFHSDRGEIGETGLAYEHIYMKAWHPEEEDAVRFLLLPPLRRSRGPALFSRSHGSERPGGYFLVVSPAHFC